MSDRLMTHGGICLKMLTKRRLNVDDEPSVKKKRGRKSLSQRMEYEGIMTEDQFIETTNRYEDITAKIMFEHGDAPDPLEENIRFLLGLMQQQLRFIVDKGKERAEKEGRTSPSLLDIIIHFRHHTLVLGRLLNFAQAAISIRSIALSTNGKSTTEDENECLSDQSNDEEQEEEEEEEGVISNPTVGASASMIFNQLRDAVDKCGSEMTSSRLLSPLFSDCTRVARGKRVASRVSRLQSHIYTRFSEARTASFVPRVRKTPVHSRSFISWLGLPPVSPSISFLLSWLAKELIIQVVDDAYMVSIQETSNVFPSNHPMGTLLPHHYEEALRRNLGWRKRGDVLFGWY